MKGIFFIFYIIKSYIIYFKRNQSNHVICSLYQDQKLNWKLQLLYLQYKQLTFIFENLRSHILIYHTRRTLRFAIIFISPVSTINHDFDCIIHILHDIFIVYTCTLNICRDLVDESRDTRRSWWRSTVLCTPSKYKWTSLELFHNKYGTMQTFLISENTALYRWLVPSPKMSTSVATCTSKESTGYLLILPFWVN